MNRKFTLLSLIILLASFGAQAGVKVTSLNLDTTGANGFVHIAIDGRSPELPDIKVFGSTIQITLSGAEPFAAISKNVKGAQLSANMLNGKAIIKALLPYEVDAKAVDLGWKNSNIEVIFPRGKSVTASLPLSPTPAKAVAAAAAVAVTVTKAPAAPRASVAEITKTPSAITKEALNEDYLNTLMNENVAKTQDESLPGDRIRKEDVKKDEINLKQAAPAKPLATANAPANKVDNFSFAGYAAKFTIFLALVLGLFYGVVQVLKKGVFNRGKLGFLNNQQMIQVLSTTYISPKKSLMIIRAHKQLFLVANSETGLQFLSEMKDTTGIIKEGEKVITGENFDMNLASLEALNDAPAFKLKEDITQSTPVPEEKGISKIAVARDIVKFSDELKKKAKKLKPIEFN